MRSRHRVGIHALLAVSVFVSVLAPLQTQAASQVPTNDPPYIIRGHVYEYGTTTGLADARVQVQYETCDAVERDALVATDAAGAWEFDERDHLWEPCAGTPFTITQFILPPGYVAVAVQTPPDPAPVIGDTILLTPPGSGAYEDNDFFDRLPYVIRGHVYQHGTTTGLAGARVQVQFETYEASGLGLRTVTLPPTDSSGAWEYDERDYGHLPCPGTPFTLTQQVVPAGYIAVRTKTPADPVSVRGDTIILTPPTSGVYDGNIFFDRRPYILRGRVIDDDTGAGTAGVEVSFDTLQGIFTTTTTAAGFWEFDESHVLSITTYLSNYDTDFFRQCDGPHGILARERDRTRVGDGDQRDRVEFPGRDARHVRRQRVPHRPAESAGSDQHRAL